MRTQEAVRSFLATKSVQGVSKRTLGTYTPALNVFSTVSPNLPCHDTLITQFLSNLPGGQHNKRLYFAILNSFFNWVEKEYKISNPMQYVPRPKCPNKVMPTLEKVDIFLILSLVEDRPRDKALIYLLIDTGIRATEAANLRRVDIRGDTILVDGKVGQRTVPISPETVDALLALPKYQHGYVFNGKAGRVTRWWVYDTVRHYLKRIGYRGMKFGPHVLRHSLGRHFLENGGDIRTLQKIMGHSSITTTAKYANLAWQPVIEQHRKYSPLNFVEVKTDGT